MIAALATGFMLGCFTMLGVIIIFGAVLYRSFRE